VARALRAETLDVVTDRLETPLFDVVIATNVLPYFDDTELALALTSIARMLASGGVFLHNEARPIMGELTAAAGTFRSSSRGRRSSRRCAELRLFGDTVWLHRKARPVTDYFAGVTTRFRKSNRSVIPLEEAAVPDPLPCCRARPR